MSTRVRPALPAACSTGSLARQAGLYFVFCAVLLTDSLRLPIFCQSWPSAFALYGSVFTLSFRVIQFNLIHFNVLKRIFIVQLMITSKNMYEKDYTQNTNNNI